MGRATDADGRDRDHDQAMDDPDRSPAVTRLIEAGRDREAARQGAGLDETAAATGPTQNGAPMDPVTQLGLLGPLVGEVVGGIDPDQLDDPTPCADFTVRGVLEHMIGGATAFAAAFRGEEAGEPELADPLARFGPALTDLAAAISAPGALDRMVVAPFGEVPGESFARFVVLDGLVHGWDMANATGQVYDPPAELVAVVDAFARQALDPLRDGQTFVDAVDPEEGATPIEHLVAYTGRTPLTPG